MCVYVHTATQLAYVGVEVTPRGAGSIISASAGSYSPRVICCFAEKNKNGRISYVCVVLVMDDGRLLFPANG